MSDKKAGPRFQIGSTRPSAGAGVVDELIGKAPAQKTADESAKVGVIVQPPVPDRDVLGEPEFTLAATDADPQTQFSHYEATISRARIRVEEVAAKAERYWRLTAGPALKEIHDNDLHKVAGFPSFEKYLADRWGMSRPRGYQLIDSVRAMGWLEGVTPEVPNERQLRAILPIGDQYGEEAAQQVWKLAEERGKTSGAALERAAVDLGYRAAIEAPKPPQALPTQPVWPSLRATVQELFDLRLMRDQVQADPAGARQFVAEIEQVLEEVKADLAAFTDDPPRDEAS